MRDVRIDLPTRGGTMAGLEFGPADRPLDVVFSHANGFNARTYASLLAPIAELRILALDLRGHGATTLPAQAEDHTGWMLFRDDLLAVLAAVASAPVVLAGHSLGANASLLAAAEEPARVKALAMFEPVLLAAEGQAPDNPGSALAAGALRRRASFPSREAALDSYRGRGAFRTWSETVLADYVAAAFRDTPDGEVTLICTPAWEAATYHSYRHDPWAAMRDTRCPTRLIKAQDLSTANLAAGPLPQGGRLTVTDVPGASHFLPMERGDVVAEVLRDLA